MKQINNILWIIKKSFKYCFFYIFVYILVLSFSTAVSILLNILNKNLINELSSSIKVGQTTGAFFGIAMAYMIVYFIDISNSFLKAFGNNFFRLNIDFLFQSIFMRRSLETPQERFFDKKFMERYSFISNNTQKISSYLNNLIMLFFSNMGTIFGTIMIFVIYEPMLIAYSILCSVISFITLKYTSKKEYELDKKQIKEQRFRDYFVELLTGKEYAKELRIYDYKSSILKKWDNIYSNLRQERLALSLKRISLDNLSLIVKFFLRVAAILILVTGIYYKKYDIGTFVMLFGLIEASYTQINKVVSTVMNGFYKDLKYINDYVEFITPIGNIETKKLNKQCKESNNLVFDSFESLESINVTYCYPNSDNPAVNDLKMHLKKGEIVSIMGYNGSGKTTLSKLLNGSLNPQRGKVAINGFDIGQEKSRVFQYFGMAPQEFSRFSLSIKEIVGLGNIKYMNDKPELTIAYRKAGIESFISKYKDSDNTFVGKEYNDDGVELSGGEWQKLIIASAYLGNPEILILDEPTASIDPLKEIDMINGLRENIKGKTAILISHRIGFARLADRIIMIENGKITEEGTHEQLLLKNGYYAKLFYEQKKVYEEKLELV